MSHPRSTQPGLGGDGRRTDANRMARLTLVAADGNRVLQRVANEPPDGGTTGSVATLIPIGAAHRTARSVRGSSPTLSPDARTPISSPAKHDRAFRNARRTIGFGQGETAVIDATSIFDGGPDGEAA